MSILLDALVRALGLILSGDAHVWQCAWVSVWIAAVATLLSCAVGLPLGFVLAVRRFRGREFVVTLSNTMLALPTVVVGLFVYAFISRGSLFGPLDLLFSPWAMVFGQFVLALPLAVALGHSAVAAVDPAFRETALSLGASPARSLLAVAAEARGGLTATCAAVGGRLIGEVGVSMMLGGNISGYTRSLTTAIALETSKGEFAFAMALGVVLMAIALGLNVLLHRLQRGARKIR
jgi:tungstate transport system permease protein